MIDWVPTKFTAHIQQDSCPERDEHPASLLGFDDRVMGSYRLGRGKYGIIGLIVVGSGWRFRLISEGQRDGVKRPTQHTTITSSGYVRAATGEGAVIGEGMQSWEGGTVST